MKRILLADAGSTKVEWALISQAGEIENTIVVSGLNALLAEQDEVKRAFISVAQNFQGDQRIEEIHYYGAGCATQSICSKMETALSDVWSDAECHVHSDLVGAARSLFGNRKGIACILGTGSNSCLYDGSGIISQIPSLGYILGDEGSGAALGRRLIGDAFKEQLPQNVKEAFLEEFHLTLEEILNRVYKSPSPNSFLALSEEESLESVCLFTRVKRAHTVRAPQCGNVSGSSLAGGEFHRVYSISLRQDFKGGGFIVGLLCVDSNRIAYARTY